LEALELSDVRSPLRAVLAAIERDRPAQLTRLFEWLRIPSISMVPAAAPDCVRAAEWVAADLRNLGFEASLRPSLSHPMVVGHRTSKTPGAPHVLFYGHYDVQPVDPLELWTRPPFEPYLTEDARNGPMIVARGSSDDKGQVMTFLDALRGWIAATGDVPVNLTVLIEGDEEADSGPLDAFIRANADELRAGVAWVCDSEAWDRTRPAITVSLRGYGGAEITVTGPSHDLHSGKYGGAAVNPIRTLTKALAALHDDDGRVQLPGFYAGISEPTAAMRERWQRLGFDPEAYLAEVGLKHPTGERGRSLLELIWTRPTVEINGIWGGYQGPGMKTVIPSEASAKVSFRLVPGQDPGQVLAAFERFVREKLPADCGLRVTPADGSRGIAFDPEAAYIAAAVAALTDEWGVAPAIVGSGGSIPVVSVFRDVLGMDTLMLGFSQDDDRAHAPNEKYNLASLVRGTRSWARVIASLAGTAG
jgi:acetylornithine deacetylase/succinyl-diaminopimelate desuccinylase-like protein